MLRATCLATVLSVLGAVSAHAQIISNPVITTWRPYATASYAAPAPVAPSSWSARPTAGYCNPCGQAGSVGVTAYSMPTPTVVRRTSYYAPTTTYYAPTTSYYSSPGSYRVPTTTVYRVSGAYLPPPATSYPSSSVPSTSYYAPAPAATAPVYSAPATAGPGCGCRGG